ncbi:hypothetical protein WCV53_31590, partial [Klebsiella pneumoniae]
GSCFLYLCGCCSTRCWILSTAPICESPNVKIIPLRAISR